MKSSIQMRVAKHMIAIWINPEHKSISLSDAFDTIDNTWPGLSRRTLRVWAKTLVNNPERYEFTGMAYKQLKLTDHFTDEEVDHILKTVYYHHRSDFDYIIRSIIQYKWVYGMSTEKAIEHGTNAFFGEDIKRRPVKPVLKPIK